VALDLYAWWHGRDSLVQVATGLLVAGVLAGVLTAAAGFLAFFTVPGHTEEAHRLMYWHPGIQAAALLLFAWPTWVRWRNWTSRPIGAWRFVACVAAVLLLVGSGVGGYIVYHGGGGIEDELLAPPLREGHHHQDGQERHQPTGHRHGSADHLEKETQ
jgi:uncharacterized membrane protein